MKSTSTKFITPEDKQLSQINQTHKNRSLATKLGVRDVADEFSVQSEKNQNQMRLLSRTTVKQLLMNTPAGCRSSCLMYAVEHKQGAVIKAIFDTLDELQIKDGTNDEFARMCLQCQMPQYSAIGIADCSSLKPYLRDVLLRGSFSTYGESCFYGGDFESGTLN
jgi:hypothetical protein